MMSERSSHISNSSMYDISYKVFLYDICPHSLSEGNKTEFAFDHLPDVDTSDGRAVCNTISQVMGLSPI